PQRSDVANDFVQNAAIDLYSSSPFFGSAPIAEQALENASRIHLMRQRLGGGSPRDRVGVRATVSVIAGPCIVAWILDCEFERRQQRVAAELLCNNLI